MRNLKLVYVDELRMGPPYYQLVINGKIVKKKLFFQHHIFDSDNTKVAITEYSHFGADLLSILWVIDLNTQKVFEISKQRNGIIQPFRFEGSKLIYIKEPLDNESRECERDLSNIVPMNIW